MPSLLIVGSTDTLHPNEDGFWLDSRHAPLPVEWSGEFLRDQIKTGLVLIVTD